MGSAPPAHAKALGRRTRVMREACAHGASGRAVRSVQQPLLHGACGMCGVGAQRSGARRDTPAGAG
eukprot:3795392-Pyramimonas_sp.AAC.1